MNVVLVPAAGRGAVRRVGPGVVACLGVPAAVLLGAVLRSPTIVTAGPVLVLLAAAEVGRRASDRRRSEADERLVRGVDALIGLLRSGASLSQACIAVGRRSPPAPDQPLGVLAAAVDSGRTLRAASTELREVEDGSVRLLAVTIGVLAERGGPAIPALERLRHTLMGRINGRRRLVAESSQAVASAGLLIAAPTLFVVVVATVEPSIGRFYLFDPLGAAVVAASVSLSGAGWLWMCWIGRRVLEGG